MRFQFKRYHAEPLPFLERPEIGYAIWRGDLADHPLMCEIPPIIREQKFRPEADTRLKCLELREIPDIHLIHICERGPDPFNRGLKDMAYDYRLTYRVTFELD